MGDIIKENNLKFRCDLNEDVKYILLPVFYGIVFCIGFTLNVLTVYIYIFKIRPWKTINVFMFNLAVSDLIYVLSLPLLIYYYSQESVWPFTNVICKLVRFLFYTSLYCSILFLLSISIYRFVAICHPIQYLRWSHPRYARIASLVIWIIVVGMQSPIWYFVSTSQSGNNTVCPDTTSEDLFGQFVIFSAVNLSLLFCVPFVVILICYSNIVYVLFKPNTNISRTGRSKVKSVKMVIVVLLVFVVCFLPFHVTRTLFYFYRNRDLECSTLSVISLAYTVTRPLASLNSCIDPILYFLVWRLSLSTDLYAEQIIDRRQLISGEDPHNTLGTRSQLPTRSIYISKPFTRGTVFYRLSGLNIEIVLLLLFMD
uniref:P2Y purinoceptor 4 n=1 Tax=Leptobrachium leishanense TaxID=445787 RepID=A0A8C5MFV0_9ANUR